MEQKDLQCHVCQQIITNGKILDAKIYCNTCSEKFQICPKCKEQFMLEIRCVKCNFEKEQYKCSKCNKMSTDINIKNGISTCSVCETKADIPVISIASYKACPKCGKEMWFSYDINGTAFEGSVEETSWGICYKHCSCGYKGSHYF